MQPQADATEQKRAVVWCEKCGIPYAAGTGYCANCGAELAREGEEYVPVAALPVAPARAEERETPAGEASDMPDEALLDAPLVPAAPMAAPGALGQRLRKRTQTLSEDEVEAAAAAIIARAREAEEIAGPDPGPRDALAFLPNLLPDPVIEAALRRKRERDRAWLIAGVICSVLLILFALAVSRYVSGVVTPR